MKACFGPFGIMLILTQDRCTVCIERTIGLDIILDAPDGTPRCRGSIKPTIWRQCLCRCKIGAHAPDGTPQ
jgi:hypothetical protein